MKRNKLLDKTLSYYFGYGSLLVLLVVPLFYYLMRRHHVHEIDEYLFSQKEQIVNKSLHTLKTEEISTWNKFNDNETILPDTGQKAENFFTTEYNYSEHERKYEPCRVLYSRVEIDGKACVLVIRLSILEARKILQTSSLLQLLLFICLMTGLALITRLIYGKLWKPFYQTLSLTEQFNIQQGEAPNFPPTGTQEFDQLNQALEKLIRNNLQAYKIQKEFTENASHEMQTPLAVFRSKLDMLLQQPELTEKQLTIIHVLYETTSRLVRMNKNLLLLAKMDNMQFPDMQLLNVAGIIEESLSFLSEQAEAEGISMETLISNKDLTLQANKFLLESLINNLLTNAIKHNSENGKIFVVLEANRLVISNTGVEKPLDSTVLFRRFGRMNPSAKSSGLGLAIVQQICLLYGWQINYAYDCGLHRFTVVF